MAVAAIVTKEENGKSGSDRRGEVNGEGCIRVLADHLRDEEGKQLGVFLRREEPFVHVQPDTVLAPRRHALRLEHLQVRGVSKVRRSNLLVSVHALSPETHKAGMQHTLKTSSELDRAYPSQQPVQNLCPHSSANRSDALTSSPHTRHSSVVSLADELGSGNCTAAASDCCSLLSRALSSSIANRFWFGWFAAHFASATSRLRNALSIVLDSILSAIASGVLYRWKSIDTTFGYGTKYGHFSASSAHLTSKQSSFLSVERRYIVAASAFLGQMNAPTVAS